MYPHTYIDIKLPAKASNPMERAIKLREISVSDA